MKSIRRIPAPEQESLHAILRALNKAYAATGSKEIEIALGELGEADTSKQFSVIEFLQQEKIVFEFKTEVRDVEYEPEADEHGQALHPGEEYMTSEIVFARCRISPDKLETYTRHESILPRFWITRNSKREIVLNEKYRLSKPGFGTENDEVFDYLYSHPNRRIRLAELAKATGRTKFKKHLRHILRDLKFTGPLKQLFFPNVSQSALEFRNPVFQRDISAARIKESVIEKLLSGLNPNKRGGEKG